MEGVVGAGTMTPTNLCQSTTVHLSRLRILASQLRVFWGCETKVSWFFGPGTDLISLLILFLVFFILLGRPHQKSLRLHHFKSDRHVLVSKVMDYFVFVLCRY